MTDTETTNRLEAHTPQYYKVDTGCSKATKFLQKQSRCLECPFPECRCGRENPASHPGETRRGKFKSEVKL